jgi:hypothetical protein
MSPLSIDKQTARRFVLGRQGLWPGRRWTGKAGAEAAMRSLEYVQMDPICPVAKSHDLMLHSRVEGYREEFFDEILYKDRLFFDYGGWLAAQPMCELPYMRVIMDRRRNSVWFNDFAAEHPEAMMEVQQAIRERGPLGNRDFEGNKRLNNYRSRKDTGNALYRLWIAGDVMTHHRKRFERVYHLREHVAAQDHDYTASAEEAERFLVLKQFGFAGFMKANSIGGSFATNYFARAFDKAEMAVLIASLEACGEITPIHVEGYPSGQYILTRDLPQLETLSAGQIPPEWMPLGPTTEDETTFLAPLEPASARGRAKPLFDFEYIWEIYKPAHLRRWGYYTQPILYGDRLVGRIEPRMDRKANTLVIDTFSMDDAALGKDRTFRKALRAGIERMAKFAGAKAIQNPF